jgi:hypothetical protein
MQYQRCCVEIELDLRIELEFVVGRIVRVKIFEAWHGGRRSLGVPLRPKQLQRSSGDLLEDGLTAHQQVTCTCLLQKMGDSFR